MSGSGRPEEIARSLDRNRAKYAGNTSADEQQAALERVRSDLADLDDEPIPEWVVKRLDNAIAEEGLNASEDPTRRADAGWPTAPTSSRPSADHPGCAALGGLIDDLTPITLVVIDFVCTRPSRAPAEPIKAAVQTIRVRDGALRREWAREGLIRPPAHAIPTRVDARQTGITPSMLASRSPASQVLAELDGRFGLGPLLLVAHDAPATAGLLFERRELCPRLAGTDLLDMLRLARNRYPELPHHTLGEVANHFGLPVPHNLHRAMPNVQLAVEVLLALIDRELRWPSLRALRAVAGHRAHARHPAHRPPSE